MCNMVYISTDCGDDLSARSSDLVRFEKPSTEKQTPYPPILKHEHKWFVGGQHACSCRFRHLVQQSVELGFREPQDWFPEYDDDVEATIRLYAVLNDMVQRGYQVDLVDCWDGEENKESVVLDVSLRQVPATHFCMFEGYLFNLKP